MTYVGEFKERLRDGLGSYAFPPRGLFSYDGQWRKGEMHGQGLFSIDNSNNNNNGDTLSYEGEFQNGEIEGIGLKRWPNGSSYSGQFHRGEMHGEGVFILSNGEKYEGQWHSNQRVGKGELTFVSGDVYAGEFASHKPHGHGQIVFAKSGNVYEGEWASGKIVGQGILSDREGNILYEGEWLDGQREGSGSGAVDGQEPNDEAANGNVVWYSGLWKQDRPTERPTRLVVKLASTASISSRPSTGAISSRPSTAAQISEQVPSVGDEGEPLVLTDLPSTVSIGENKKLPQFVVLSVYDPPDEDTENPPAAAENSSLLPAEGDQQTPNDVTTPLKNTQWFFVQQKDFTSSTAREGTEKEVAPPAPEASADENNGEGTAAGSESTTEEQPEERMAELVVENAMGIAHFQRLALPATTLPGIYHILCESVSSTDSLPLVVINLCVG
ncbi:hypothetical protein Gpo141_00003906 [Globisporangium polare]